jgi:hypothetical protein
VGFGATISVDLCLESLDDEFIALEVITLNLELMFRSEKWVKVSSSTH